MKLYIDLAKAKMTQMGLFGAGGKPAVKPKAKPKAAPKPPGAGWQMIPGGKKGGFRKPSASGGYTYWYPETGVGQKPHPEDTTAPAPDALTQAKDQRGRYNAAVFINATLKRIAAGERVPDHLAQAKKLGGRYGEDYRVLGSSARVAELKAQLDAKDAPVPVKVGKPEAPGEAIPPKPLDPAAISLAELEGLGRQAARDGKSNAMPLGLYVPGVIGSNSDRQKAYIRGWSKEMAEMNRLVPEPPKPPELPPEPPKVATPPTKPKPKKAPEKPSDKPEDRQFVDYGGLIEGSRLQLSRMTPADMKANPQLARKLVTRSNVVGTWKPDWAEADKANGVSPEASHMKRAILALVTATPYDSDEARDDYRAGCKALLNGLSRVRTAQDVEAFLGEWEDAVRGQIEVGEPFVRGLVPMKVLSPWVERERQRQGNDDGREGEYKVERRDPPPVYRVWHGHDGWVKLTKDSDPTVLHSVWAADHGTGSVFQAAFGITGYADRADGKVQALGLAPEDDDRINYKRYTKALGKRFAELSNHTVRMRYRKPQLLSYRAGWGKELEPTDTRKGLAIDAGLATEGKDPWAWAGEKKDKKGKDDKPPKVVEKGDKSWVWVRPTMAVERKGPPVPKPKDSTEFAKAFGMPQVNYGKWANDAERQWHVDNAFGALHDLSEAVGIPAEHLAINGRLKLAFGARGTGGKKAPAAHYEGATRAINLTKLNGAGSLAHEWAHYMDHAISIAHGVPSSGKKTPLLSRVLAEGSYKAQQSVPEPIKAAMRDVLSAIKYEPETPAEKDARREKAKKESGKIHAQMTFYRGELAPLSRKISQYVSTNDERLVAARKEYSETVDAFNELVKPYNAAMRRSRGMDLETDHFQAANAIGGTYYNDNVELFARSFESFVEDKLHEKGRHNTYLVAATRDSGLAGKSRSPESGIYIPPDHPHRARVNAAIEKLLGVLRTNDQFRKALAGEWLDSLIKAQEPRLVL